MARADRQRAAAVKDQVPTPEAIAGRYGLFALLRKLEREHPDKPRIGHSHNLRQEYVSMGQDPFLTFPDADITKLELGKKTDIRTPVLGFFGPQGALPLNTTEEVARWVNSGDESFVKFCDIFNERFLQLFFRSWSDAHAISQYDHPDKDRFQGFVGALSGVGTKGFRGQDSIPDVFKTSMVSLHGSRVKSPIRLRQMIEHHLQAEVQVEEHVSTWLEFEAGDRNAMGMQGATLGRDMFLGARLQSVSERILLHIRTRSLQDYRRYLPGGDAHANLADIVFWYVGKTMEVGVELSLPSDEVPPAQLGQSIELGWMAAVEPSNDPDAPEFVAVARYTLDPNSKAAEAA